MKLCKVRLASGEIAVGILKGDYVHLLDPDNHWGIRALSDLLHYGPGRVFLDPHLLRACSRQQAISEVTLLAPIDRQEVWAAGVTYKRSQEARERESVGAARFYDLVYTAPRPELFFKATPGRVVGPGEPVHIRGDSRWSVPEPELALVLSPSLELVGYTIGNDMSARDVEGENPLYLPQAKVYDACCSLGPCVTVPMAFPPLDQATIRMTIERQGKTVFDGTTPLSAMARSFEDLICWLGRETSFPDGAILLTGTGIVPPDDFTLAEEDTVAIEITGIGKLVNLVGSRG